MMATSLPQPTTAVLATMHGKEKVIAPLVKVGLGIAVWTPSDFDTDAFGTFTREKKRLGDQLEAARAKARAAMERYGYQIGIASEGSFGSHPLASFLPHNTELAILLDDRYGIEVIGQFHNNAPMAQGQKVYGAAEAMEIATTWGFPEQGVIIRRSQHGTRGIYKEVTSMATFEATVAKLFKRPFVRSLYLETDMRAHRHTTRMEAIAQATKTMIAAYLVRCPAYQAPGFRPTEVTDWAVCARCQRPSTTPCAYTNTCQVCQHTAIRAIDGAAATVSPAQCAHCNP